MPKNILLIDDEELIIKSLRILLEKNGFNVFIAKNGQDALEISEEESFDLVIADIRMPGMNGVEIIRTISEKIDKKNSEKIPVIFITGYADDEIKQKAESLEPVAYIYKPFETSYLMDKIKAALD